MTGKRLRPPLLRVGMKIGVVAPSGFFTEPSTASLGVETLERIGFTVELGAHTGDVYGHLAGSDVDRADDLLTMLERPDIDGVICLRGGGGALRTALALDPVRLERLATAPPKVFVGFSDITVIHAVLERALGWVTFYGPVLSTLAHPSEYVLAGFKQALMSAEPFQIGPDPDAPYVDTLVPGVAEAELAGGCLTLLSHLVGTPWEPDLAGRILCFEDVNEEPYAIERSLCHLLASGRLANCAGIVIGEHANCEPSKARPSLALGEIFRDLLAPLGVPTIYHLPIGHGHHIATLPLGARARLDANVGTLQILDGVVVAD